MPRFPLVRPDTGRALALGLPALVLILALAACAAPSTPSSDLADPTGTERPTRTTEASHTPTDLPSETPEPSRTPDPLPTEPPVDRTISSATLAQLRPLWVLDEPGNPNAQSGCQDMACWMLTRIGSYAFSPDGTTLAVGVCTVDSTENTTNPRHYRFNCDGPAEVRLYDAATGSLRQTLAVGDFPLSLAFHPDRALLAVGMAHRSLEIWDLESGQKLQTLLHSTTRDGVVGLQFSPDGAILASYGDLRLQLWQWERGLPAGLIEDVADFDFGPTGDTLATLFWSERGDYAEARFYPLDDLERFRAFRLDWSKNPYRVFYTPDGVSLIALGNPELEMVDPATGKIVHEADFTDLLPPGEMSGYGGVTSQMTEDGRLIITATVRESELAFRAGLGLWDPRSAAADAWLMSYEELFSLPGARDFGGFEDARITLAPRNHFLTAEDYGGMIWIWGVDPTAPPDGVTCLGTCAS